MGRRTDVNLALQALSLSRDMPHGLLSLTSTHLTWEGQVQPLSGTGDTYVLRLTGFPARPPTIHVVSPDLVPDKNGCLPHVYDTGSLCVSKAGDFHPGMLFVDTVLPWALEWLIFYELWRATGTWFGDGPDHLDAASQERILHPYKPPRTLPAMKGR